MEAGDGKGFWAGQRKGHGAFFKELLNSLQKQGLSRSLSVLSGVANAAEPKLSTFVHRASESLVGSRNAFFRRWADVPYFKV